MKCDWKQYRLGDVVDINPYVVLPKGKVAKKVSMDKLQPNCRDIPAFEMAEYSGGAKFVNGDTIMARITPCLENGKIAQVSVLEDGEVGFGSTEYIVFRAKEGLTDADFVYSLVCSNFVREPAIKSMVGSSGRQRVQTDVVQNLVIAFPPINEQIKIGKLLSKLDEKISINNKINNNLADQLAISFDKIYNEGMSATLDDILDDVQSGSRPRGGAEAVGIPSIGAENIERFGVYDFSKDKYISNEYFSALKRGIVRSGDVLLYKDGAYTGKVSMALDGFPHERCAVNEHVFILRTEREQLQFSLYCLLARDDLRQKIFALASSKAAQPGLNQNELRSIPILLPPMNELLRFERYASPLMYMIANNANENKRLSALRDALLPKLMSGEIDVSDVQI